MTCETLVDENGQPIAIGCTRGPRKRKLPCAFCGAPDAGWLCDHPVGRKKTCDKPICGGCRVNVGPERDICPEHQRGRSQLDLFSNASGAAASAVAMPASPAIAPTTTKQGKAEAAARNNRCFQAVTDEPSGAAASAEPVRTRPNAREPVERFDRTCPACSSDRVVLLGVEATKGVGAELITTFACDACRHRFAERRPRTDVCEHGRFELVPCVDCGRTWDSIQWPKKGATS